MSQSSDSSIVINSQNYTAETLRTQRISSYITPVSSKWQAK
jgi:hypothetical protein